MRGGPIRSKGVTLFRGTTYQKKAPEDDIPEPLSKAQKRCHLCFYKKDRKTKKLCQKCRKNVCKDHSIIMCRQCM
ncbi:hypothetical protein LAZ67_13001038 [Cordylochernes scorpioides]|uniref:PiggyBac transposable element-derived protein 4 C-terminal zinc-ribbon domain-containing protein n=1 Tax=Cordylochernes scorpioides TaxID=51811 RepID=A0ABY6L3G5_9ARAC|nr:hypothetical protein LAZ67_13001038 [Cordylochernes scorpioides]